MEKLAKEALGQKDYSAAAQRYREYLLSVTKPEDKAHGLKTLGELLMVMGSFEEAKIPLEKLFEDHKDSDDRMIRHKLAQGSAILGTIYFEQKDIRTAFKYWSEISKYTFGTKGE